MNLNRRTLEQASANIKRLDDLVSEEKKSNTVRLQ